MSAANTDRRRFTKFNTFTRGSAKAGDPFPATVAEFDALMHALTTGEMPPGVPYPIVAHVRVEYLALAEHLERHMRPRPKQRALKVAPTFEIDGVDTVVSD